MLINGPLGVSGHVLCPTSFGQVHRAVVDSAMPKGQRANDLSAVGWQMSVRLSGQPAVAQRLRCPRKVNKPTGFSQKQTNTLNRARQYRRASVRLQDKETGRVRNMFADAVRDLNHVRLAHDEGRVSPHSYLCWVALWRAIWRIACWVAVLRITYC